MAIANRLSQQVVVVVVVPSRRSMRNLTAVSYSLGGDDSFGSYHPRGVWRWRGRARAFASHVRLRVWTIGKLRLRAPPARARKSLYATVNCDAPCPKCLGLEWLQLGGILALIFYWEWRNFNCKLQISIDTRGCGSVPSLIRPSRTLSH